MSFDDAPLPSPERNDADLIAATRRGDTTAYGVLYERHVHSAQRLASILASDRSEADDLVSETFAKVLSALGQGKGPDLAFRAYLLTTLRNTFYQRTRRDKKVQFTDDMLRHDHGEAFVDPAIDGQERRYIARAFRRLPQRWQVVLWHTEVEGESPATVATLLGLSPNGVSALAYRARERLRQMYLQEHINDSPAAACRWTSERLGAHVRGGLSVRDTEKVDQHLDECAGCKILLLELTEVNSGMRGVLAPVLLGLAAPAYLGVSTAKGTAIGAWFAGIATGAVDLGARAVAWVRGVLQSPAGRSWATVGGATAVVAGVIAVAMLANSTPPETPSALPPSAQQPPADPETSPPSDPDEEAPQPPGDEDEEEPDRPGGGEGEDSDDGEDEPDAPGGDFTIGSDITSTNLVAGSNGTLPITISAPDSTADNVSNRQESGASTAEYTAGSAHTVLTDDSSAPTSMTVDLPAGVRPVAGDAGDGWTCNDGEDTAVCTRAELDSSESSTAHIPLAVDDGTTGFQDLTVSVTANGLDTSQQLRVAVAPSGTQVGYASMEATGVSTAGNTLMTCRVESTCQLGLRDNETAMMSAYRADSPPSGLADGMAVSGARLDVPAGATVLWAGLHWAASDTQQIPDVQVLAPGSGWTQASAQRSWSGSNMSASQSAVDITSMVAGSGTYWVAADEDRLPTGLRNYAGWSITAVYQMPGAPKKETAVYEGLAQPAWGGSTSVAVPGGHTEVAYTLWDGDQMIRSDYLSVCEVRVDEADNIGRSNSPNAVEGEGWNTLGVDVNQHRVSAPAQPSEVKFFTGTDRFSIGVLAVASSPPA